MFIEKLRTYSNKMVQVTILLENAISEMDTTLIAELVDEISKINKKIERYTEKSIVSANKEINSINNGTKVKPVKLFEGTARNNRIDSISYELITLVCDKVENRIEVSSELQALENEMIELTKSPVCEGLRLTLEVEKKYNNNWNFVGRVYTLDLDLDSMKIKKTKKALYLYNSNNTERYILKSF